MPMGATAPPAIPADLAKSAKPMRSWDAANELEFARWKRITLSKAKLAACLVTNEAYRALRFVEFYQPMSEAAQELSDGDENGWRAWARQVLASDRSELSLDFQPTTFKSAIDVLDSSITGTVTALCTRIPAVAPLVQGMRLGTDQEVRLSDEIASTCRREFGNAVSQMSIFHSRARAGRSLLEDNETNLGTVAKNVGRVALALANPWIGVPMALAGFLGESKHEENSRKQVVEFQEAMNTFGRWADEANEGVGRAMQSILQMLESKLVQFIELVVRAFVESGSAPTVNWKAMCETSLLELAPVLRTNCEEAPALRAEFMSLSLDPEVYPLIPREPDPLPAEITSPSDETTCPTCNGEGLAAGQGYWCQSCMTNFQGRKTSSRNMSLSLDPEVCALIPSEPDPPPDEITLPRVCPKCRAPRGAGTSRCWTKGCGNSTPLMDCPVAVA